MYVTYKLGLPTSIYYIIMIMHRSGDRYGKNLPKHWSNSQPNQLLGNKGFIEIGQHYCPTKVASCSTVGQVNVSIVGYNYLLIRWVG